MSDERFIDMVGGPGGDESFCVGLDFEKLPKIIRLPLNEDLRFCQRHQWIVAAAVYELRKVGDQYRYEFREIKYGEPEHLDLTSPVRFSYVGPETDPP
jgi:hypothetical protein